MSFLSKVSSGFLYDEKFENDISLIWELSPNDYNRIAINSDSISLLPNGERLELLMPCPKENDFVFQTNISYTPTDKNEDAGCILKSTTENYAELSICGDDPETTTAIKMQVDSSYVLNARCLVNDKMIDYGNTRLVDANFIGFYLNKTSTIDNFKIHNICMCKNNYITIRNFDRTHNVKVFDSNGIEITEKFYIKKMNTKVIIDCTNMLFPIDKLILKIYDSFDNELYSKEMLDIYGGDVYEYSQSIRMYIDNNELDDNIYGIKNSGNVALHILKIENCENYEMHDKTLQIEAYDPYNPGYQNVYISELQGGNPVDNYEKVKTGIDLKIAEIKEYSLKIIRNDKTLVIDDDYKFKITFQ